MIELKNISKTYYDNGKKVEALKNINLSFNPGEIVGIIGYSGAGKSTLLRCINLLEPPTTGEVIINGVTLNTLNDKELREIRKKIGMIFQHFNLMKSRTISKNISYPLKGSNLWALANKPDIILCDEATSALDPETTISILKLLKKVNQELGVTIILITHQMEVIKEICDRVIVMEDGEIKEQGDIVEVFSRPKADITKKFLSTIFNSKKISEYLENLPSKPDEHFIKLSYIGENAEEAYISKISRELDIDASILFGNIEIIKGTSIGNLIVKFEGSEEKVSNAINYLNQNNIDTEVLKNVGICI